VSSPFKNPKTPWILATASAVICWLAYVGPGIWPLAFVSWTPFVLAIRGQTPKRGTWIAFYAGTAMIAGGFYWLLGMLKTFSGFPLPLCALFALILWAYQGGRYALTGWLALRAEQRGWSFGFAFVAAYATTELLYPLLFPYYWAAAMHKAPVMMQIADLGGPILVTVVVMGVNVALAELVMARLTGQADKRVIQVAGGALLFTFAYGLFQMWRVGAKMEASEALHVGVVQGNLGLMQQHTRPDESKRRHLAATRALKQKGAELVVWSESSVDYAAEESQKDSFYKANITGGLGVPLIFGTVLIHVPTSSTDREHFFNTALSSDAQGNITGRYDKEFLLAFGEYLPLGETFPILYDWSPNSGRFTPGTKLDALPIGNHKVGVLVCYEDIIPTFVNDIVRAEDPDLLVNITNDAWFGVTYEPWQHLALAQMRAVEHRRYLIRATNSGVSAIIDPMGRLVATSEVRDVQAHIKDADTLDGTVRWIKQFTVYGAVGDLPWYFVALGSIVAAFRKKKPSTDVKLREGSEAGEGSSVKPEQEKDA
jgi:apolipoprotein N-acyltransferase